MAKRRNQKDVLIGIKILGVGGSGSNIVSRIHRSRLRGVEFFALNTDIQALRQINGPKKIQIGKNTTAGLGTGMDLELGRKSAEESKDDIEEILKGAEMVFITCGLGGGCLRGSSLILTNPEGPVRIDSIKPGSLVYTYSNGNLVKRKVLATMKTGIKKVLELKTNNRTIYASEDHPFLKVKPLNILSNGRFSKFRPEWAELRNLKVGDLVVILRKLPDGGESLKLPNGSFPDEKFCQLFGFLLGDGWISRSIDSWKIFFSPSNNEEKNQKYLNLIQEVFHLRMKRRKNRYQDWYQGNSKKIYELLEKIGLHKPAKEKEIPNWVFTLPERQKKSFIIGLADADGHYSTQIGKTGLPKKEIKFEMSSEKLIRGLKVLCDTIGLRTSNVTSRKRVLKPPNSKEEREFTSWTIRIYKTHELTGILPHSRARSGVSFLYKFRSRRPPEFFKYFGFNWIKSIKEIGNEEVYDITVEGSHNFIADGFVVHNTGSGAAPVIAEISKNLGILTVAIVTTPFSFEGKIRREIAENALQELKNKVDTLITISNNRLLAITNKETSLLQAFSICDNILKDAISGISEIILSPGLVNVDFADIKTIMKDSGVALMGVGTGEGEEKAILAAKEAIQNPLLDLSLAGAKGIVFCLRGGKDLTLYEVNEAAKIITQNASEGAKIIFGAIIDEDLKEKIKITVIASGFNREIKEVKKEFIPLHESFKEISQELERGKTKEEEELEVPAFLRKKIKF